jgi:hypothetical protein
MMQTVREGDPDARRFLRQTLRELATELVAHH